MGADTTAYVTTPGGPVHHLLPPTPHHRPMAGHVIGLMGFAGSGKDEFGNVAVNRFGFSRVAFADALRDMALGVDPIIERELSGDYVRLGEMVERLGWEGAKRHPEVRRTLQRLGTEGVRNVLGVDTWVDHAFDHKIIPTLNEGVNVVVTDVRFPNEVKAVLQAGGKMVRVDRKGYAAVNHHSSEHAWRKFRADYVVLNNGSLEEYGEHVSVVIRHVLRTAGGVPGH